MQNLTTTSIEAQPEDNVNIDGECFKKALRKIGKNVETHGMLSPSDFTNEDISLLYSLGYNLYERGDYLQSKDIFQRLVLSRPYEIKFWQALGASLQMQRCYEEALDAWSMASFINDEDPTVHFHAAECLYSLELFKDARQALEHAKERSKNDPLVSFEQKIKSLEDLLTKAG